MSANPVSMCDRCAVTPDFGRAINIRIQKAGGTCHCALKVSEDNDTPVQSQPCLLQDHAMRAALREPQGGQIPVEQDANCRLIESLDPGVPGANTDRVTVLIIRRTGQRDGTIFLPGAGLHRA